MRIKYVVAFTLLLGLLTNCSSDGNNKNFAEMLLGTWVLKEKRLDGQTITHDCDLLSTVEFNNNYLYSEKYYTPDFKGDCQLYETQATYTISENNLIIDYINPETTQIIIPFSVSSESLIYKNESGSNTFIFAKASE